jgi:hypothetical protein
MEENHSSNVLEQQVTHLLAELWEFPTLRQVIDWTEVEAQQMLHQSPFAFTEIVSEAVNSLLYQMESSESARDMIALQNGLLLADKEVVTAALKTALQQGAIYLFPYDVEQVIQQHQLPFTTDDLVRSIEQHWLFGFILPAIPDWYFLTFVNRQEPNDTYTTGFKKQSHENV